MPPATRFPLALLPVRLETRFDTAQGMPVLRVRIFPDTLHVDSHEPALSPADRDALERWRNGPRDVEAWRLLVAEVGGARAAYLAEVFRTGADVGERAAAWTRAPELRMLPARWTVIVTAHDAAGAVLGSVRRTTEDVQLPLAVGPAPGADLDATDEHADLGPDARWLFDFDAAVARGMAVVLSLRDEVRPAPPVDHYNVVAFGLPDGDDDAAATAGADGLAALLAAHRYTDGLAFLEAGMPTNHTGGESPPWASTEPPAAERFDAEVGDARAADQDGSAADTLGGALGFGAEPLARAPGATADHRGAGDDAAAVQKLLWPATLGYFLEQMLSGALALDDASIERVRGLFVDHVRNRGPLPLVRAGRNPYGVLPVTSLARWRARDREGLDERVVGVLRGVLDAWRASVDRAPRLAADGVGAEHLARILGQSPVSTRYTARSVMGAAYTAYLYDFMRKPLGDPWWVRQRVLARAGWDAAKLPDRGHRLQRAVFADAQVALAAPVVEAAPGDAPPAYLATLAAADLAALRAAAHLEGTTPLFYRLARQALLGGYLSAARQTIRAGGSTEELLDPEMIGVTRRGGGGTVVSPWTWLDHRPVAGGETIGEQLQRRADGPVASLADAYRGLARLTGVPARRLDALVREALDLCAYRADAWATAVATVRLAKLRETAPRGVHVGGYGWIERLRPTPAAAATAPEGEGEGGPVVASTVDGGYIHAPTLGHATTAALLRNGYLVHRATATSPFEIDLSSARIQRAATVLDVVRAGQSLGAALGRRFERTLAQHEAPVLGHLAPAFRRFASTTAGDGAAAGRACDGLALVERRDRIPWGDLGLPDTGTTAHAALQPLLDELADVVDAVADLAVAEGTHQLAAGHPERAALLDAIAQGEPPPAELHVIDSAARGVGLEQRVIAVVPANAAAPAAAGWAMTPRAAAEPAIEAWCAELFGAASDYVARVAWPVAGAPTTEVTPVTLAELRVAAVDVVYGAAELEARVLHHARGLRPAGVAADVVPVLARDGAPGGRTLDDAIVLGRALADALGAARAATPADLGAAGDADLAALAGRVDDAALDQALAALAADPAAGLVAAWHLGVAGAVPSTDESRWAAQASAAITTLRKRAAELAAEPRPVGVRRLGLLVGTEVRIAPPFRLAAPHVDAALAAQRALAGDDVLAPATWLRQVGTVRAGAGHLDRALLLADVLAPRADAALDLRVAQLPLVPGERWIGTALVRDDEGDPPRARTGFLFHAPLGLAGGSDVAALVIDQWSETVPEPKVTTGLAFQYDQPGAQAPQAILLAVPPDDEPVWTEAAVEAVLAETIGLVHARAVDIDVVRAAGQYLPALYVPINLAGDTASTDFFPGGPA